jgi:hypothetical protein
MNIKILTKLTVAILQMTLLASACAPVKQQELSSTIIASETNTTAISETLLPPTSPPTQQLTPTQTLLPTLPPEAARKKVIALMQTNGNCKLPCFWGFTPGRTNEEDFLAFRHSLLAFAPESEIKFLHDDVITSVDVTAQERINSQTNVIAWIDINMTAYRQAFI